MLMTVCRTKRSPVVKGFLFCFLVSFGEIFFNISQYDHCHIFVIGEPTSLDLVISG